MVSLISLLLLSFLDINKISFKQIHINILISVVIVLQVIFYFIGINEYINTLLNIDLLYIKEKQLFSIGILLLMYLIPMKKMKSELSDIIYLSISHLGILNFIDLNERNKIVKLSLFIVYISLYILNVPFINDLLIICSVVYLMNSDHGVLYKGAILLALSSHNISIGIAYLILIFITIRAVILLSDKLSINKNKGEYSLISWMYLISLLVGLVSNFQIAFFFYIASSLTSLLIDRLRNKITLIGKTLIPISLLVQTGLLLGPLFNIFLISNNLGIEFSVVTVLILMSWSIYLLKWFEELFLTFQIEEKINGVEVSIYASVILSMIMFFPLIESSRLLFFNLLSLSFEKNTSTDYITIVGSNIFIITSLVFIKKIELKNTTLIKLAYNISEVPRSSLDLFNSTIISGNAIFCSSVLFAKKSILVPIKVLDSVDIYLSELFNSFKFRRIYEDSIVLSILILTVLLVTWLKF